MTATIKIRDMNGFDSSNGHNNSDVICQLTDTEGIPLGDAMYLPKNTGPLQLQQLVNTLLQNEEKVPYAFYIEHQELVVELSAHLRKYKVSVDKLLHIVYQPQANFRIHPVNQCSATIEGHTEAVLSVAFSPDSTQLASGSEDTNVRLWDINTQTPLFTCSGHKNSVLYIAWSADGNHLVSGSKTGELLMWDTRTGKQFGHTLDGHKQMINGISWEPVHLKAPCRRFVSSSEDGVVCIWDIILHTSIVLAGYEHPVTCVKWGGDGKIYASSRDKIRVWESEQGRCIRTLMNRGHCVYSFALSTEYTLRTGAFDHAGNTFSSPEEMKEAALAKYKKMRGNAPERLVSISDFSTMFLWEPEISEEPKACITGHQGFIHHVYFSPDGQWIASASNDHSVKLWNGITGSFVTSFRGHVGPIIQLSWSADSRLLLSGTKTLKVWDVREKKLKQELLGHTSEVYAVDWSPDGKKVASGGKDKVLKLWMSSETLRN